MENLPAILEEARTLSATDLEFQHMLQGMSALFPKLEPAAFPTEPESLMQ